MTCKQISRLAPPRELASFVSMELQLRYLGIDFRCSDLSFPASQAVVIEVNENPGLTHYFLQGNYETSTRSTRSSLGACSKAAPMSVLTVGPRRPTLPSRFPSDTM